MPQPTSSLATLRPDLGSMLAFDLLMNQEGFIWNRVLPILNVGVQSGTFGKIPLKELLQSKDTRRAPGGGYGRGNFKFTPTTYACLENGWEEAVDDREAKMYANYFDAEVIAEQRAAHIVLESAERRVASLVFNTTTYTGSSLTTAITNEWDDHANATPVLDVKAAKKKIWTNSGLKANALICNWEVFQNLRLCDEVIAAIQSGGAGQSSKQTDITPDLIARVLDLEQVIVAGAAKNTANENASASIDHIWSNEYAMVCRVGKTNDVKEACLGNTFHWSEDGSQPLGTVETYRDESVRSNIVRVRHDTDELIKYVEAGHLLSNITT